jgi:Ti-type conjugative transfer relaxase TraA
MMTFSPIAAAAVAVEYFENLAEENYFQKGGEPPGIYIGGLSQTMWALGEVKAGELALMLQGFHPKTGEKLASNAGQSHKPGWDFTFSAPKSVSMVWALGGVEIRESVKQAQAKAVESALSFLEQHAFSSRDRNDSFEKIDKVLAVAYEHGTSRELDAQLHTHLVTANLGMRSDGTICAIDFDSRWKMAAGAVYRAKLAHEMKMLGFSIHHEGKGSFGIVGIQKSICDVFSTRQKQILSYAQETGFTSHQGMKIATLATRQTKQFNESRASLIDRWEELGRKNGIDSTNIQHLRTFVPQQLTMPTHAQMFELMTEKMSTFTPMQLHHAVAVAAQGIMDVNEIDKYMTDLLCHPELVRLIALNKQIDKRSGTTERRYTTQNQIKLEETLVEDAKKRHEELNHYANPTNAIVLHSTLTEEQKTALHYITVDSGAVKIVQGMAGTGKGFMLNVANEAWKAAGFDVLGAALAGKAADGLEQSSGIRSQTVHSLIDELKKGKITLSGKSILVIDEAGMIGSKQLSTLLNQIHQAGAKAVLVGDSRQLQPIDAGGAFRLLTERLGSTSLRNIIRQHDAIDREIVRQFAEGSTAKALVLIKEHGGLTVSPNVSSSMLKMEEEWAAVFDPSKPQETLMLAGTRAETFQLNQLARERAHRENRLGRSIQVMPIINDVCYEREFAENDRIIFCRNNRSIGVKNGELGTVKGIDIRKDGQYVFQVQLDCGRAVQFVFGASTTLGRLAYQEIEHGYAMSVHKSQGVTADNVFVLMSEKMCDREWNYVGLSRSREKTQLFCTEDLAKQLDTIMSRSRQKDTSLDYQQEREIGD